MELLIWGVNGFGRCVIELAQSLENTPYTDIGLLADGVAPDTEVFGIPVLGGRQYLKKADARKTHIAVAIVRPALRKLALEEVWAHGLQAATLISPQAYVSKSAEIGEGSLLLPGVVLNACSRLGRGVQMNPSSSLGHDSSLDDFCTLFTGARVSGDSHVGVGCKLGANATIIAGCTIGSWCDLQPGATVFQDLPDFCCVMGNPAQITEQKLSSPEARLY